MCQSGIWNSTSGPKRFVYIVGILYVSTLVIINEFLYKKNQTILDRRSEEIKIDKVQDS